MRKVVILTAAVSLVLASVTAAAAVTGTPLEEVIGGNIAALWDTEPAPGNLPDNDRARGVVFDGLRPGRSGGPCAGGLELIVGGETLCTPGPDRAPAGVDVRRGRTIAELRRSAQALSSESATSGEAAAGSAVPVIGDGTSGDRVLAVYAVAADRPDRYAEVAPLIADWAAHVDTLMNQSAARTGGERHVRFVTDSAGALDVARVVLPTSGDDSMGNTISALRAAGYDDPSRKYLIWMDASLYCGIANIYSDDRPGQDNANNGRYPQYARVDSGCWGFPTSVELHELVHTMGAVQQSAPHSTPGWHCTDEYDRMCYKDSSSVEMTYVCEGAMENNLDCGHDDYFHTAPPAGSYLASHWNVANSSFLHAGPADDPPPPPPPPGNTAPEVTAAGPATVTLPDAAVLDGTVSDDGPYTTLWSQVSGPGSVTFADENAEDTTATFSVAGNYVLQLTADDGELTGDDTVAISVEDAPTPPPGNTAPEVTAAGPVTVTLPAAAVLDGTVSDDGPYTTLWSQVSGPETVTFADENAEDTTATFSVAGDYVVQLTADDGELTGNDTVAITVEGEAAPPPPPDPEATTGVFEGSLNKKWTARTFEMTVADGPAEAVMTFGGRGKKGASVELTVNLYDVAGELITTATGTSPIELTAPLAAGTYSWEVTGDRASFSLAVTYLAP